MENSLKIPKMILIRSIIDALITQKDEEGASLSDIDIVDNIATFL